jgi:hypothetical protein
MRTALLSAIAAVALGVAALPSTDAFAQRGHGGPGIHGGGPGMGAQRGGSGPRMGGGGGPRMGGHIGSGPRVGGYGPGPRVGNNYAYRGHRGWNGGRRYIGPGIAFGFAAPYAYASCYQVRRVPTRWGLQYRRVWVC